ncbi:hypothetical protein [Blastococcus sp. TF02A-26]|uniref:hypothetical protein n=1 Tax=Blastococcus sp. TF02A-26 TaxID=2250577 RepID=UPI000DEA61C9|nr:hypothetical protein [Blastococcus sp. TF02A-26]RBY84319.1 hypothetical protein DQ240_14420 [Blastococcus sp. TF02A-26]
MSISLVLLPLAVAAATAIQDRMERRQEAGRLTCSVDTRMRDGGLLAAALTDTGATVDATERDGIRVHWSATSAVFERDTAGIWSAHFSGDVDETTARERIIQIDRAYGRQVQAAVLARLRERAPAAGFTLTTQRLEDDDSVTLVLTQEV